MATELCITKGQEGTIAGWQSKKSENGKTVLDTVFVKLTNPPIKVQIEGLPENVVPICTVTEEALCVLPDETVLQILREQAPILPCFSMTDYGSQGKSRPYNPVDLNRCRTHQSIYTCLSRCTTADGLIIIQPFDEAKLKGGVTGYLRQEFRELELLDEITKLRYENKLPKSSGVTGHIRNIVLHQYRNWKGQSYVPKNIHLALAWTKEDFPNDNIISDSPWKLMSKNDAPKPNQNPKQALASTFVPAQGSVSIKKRKREEDVHEMQNNITKKSKDTILSDLSGPIGLNWDNDDWSCGYDALFTILYNIWRHKPKKWNPYFKKLNIFSKMMVLGFGRVKNDGLTLEDVRDTVRYNLNQKDNIMYPYGHALLDIHDLVTEMFDTQQHIVESNMTCSKCNYCTELKPNLKPCVVLHGSDRPKNTIAKAFMDMLIPRGDKTCLRCHSNMLPAVYFLNTPDMLVIYAPATTWQISPSLKVNKKQLYLRGIVYHGEDHFTCRIIDPDGTIWFHDGLKGNACVQEGVSKNGWNICRGKKVVCMIYAQK